jgi:hypothetical protein
VSSSSINSAGSTKIDINYFFSEKSKKNRSLPLPSMTSARDSLKRTKLNQVENIRMSSVTHIHLIVPAIVLNRAMTSALKSFQRVWAGGTIDSLSGQATAHGIRVKLIKVFAH